MCRPSLPGSTSTFGSCATASTSGKDLRSIGKIFSGPVTAPTISGINTSGWTWRSNATIGFRRLAPSNVSQQLPLLAYIGGKPQRFTSKDHIFYSGEAILKPAHHHQQFARDVDCQYQWEITGSENVQILKSNTGSGGIVLPTGTERSAGIGFSTRIVKAPGEVNLPARPVEVKLQAKFQLGSRVTQEDSFQFTILPKPTVPRSEKPLYLFDPQGQTTRLLKKLDITKIPFAPTSELSKSDTLIIGKNALTIDGPAPPIDRVRDGLKVIVFEQQPEVLEKRLGFRVQQYGLRQVFPRCPIIWPWPAFPKKRSAIGAANRRCCLPN